MFPISCNMEWIVVHCIKIQIISVYKMEQSNKNTEYSLTVYERLAKCITTAISHNQ